MYLEFVDKKCDSSRCLVCHSKGITIALMPCGHAAACISCGYALKKCPKCEQDVKSLVKIYLS